MNTRVRAVIIKNNKVLLIKRIKPEKTYWVFPGGAVEKGETNEKALKRECLEELGLKIKVKKFLKFNISEKPEILGQKEFFYLCEIEGGALGSGEGPEFKYGSNYVGSYEFEWIKIERLNNLLLLPVTIRDLIYQSYA